ncbi:MAG: recombinase family protein, partial [Bacteroidaceae bacterium]|nr:recombinase family protein [Bacteroidaceae bacterium]
MAKIGYIFLAKNYLTKDEDTAWMKDFGCESIVEEQA